MVSPTADGAGAAPPASKILNRLNVNAMNTIKNKMKEDPNMAAAAPMSIQVELDLSTGVAKGPGGLVCASLADTQISGLDPSMPTPLAYCPLFAAACYSLVVLIKASGDDLQLDEFSSTTKTNVNLAGFYNLEKAKEQKGPAWTSVNLEAGIKAPVDQDKLTEMGAYAHERCPASQLLRSSSIKFNTSVKGTQVASEDSASTDGVLNGYNLAQYKAMAAKVASDPKCCEKEQICETLVYCNSNSECKEFPGTLMKISSGNLERPEVFTTHLAGSMDEPVGDGKYPSFVASCLFGGCAFYCHTFAIRLSLRGIRIKSLKGTLSTTMNKRVLFAIDEGEMFKHVNVDLEVESDASPEVLEEVRKETDLMCPTVRGMQDHIDFNIKITKK